MYMKIKTGVLNVQRCKINKITKILFIMKNTNFFFGSLVRKFKQEFVIYKESLYFIVYCIGTMFHEPPRCLCFLVRRLKYLFLVLVIFLRDFLLRFFLLRRVFLRVFLPPFCNVIYNIIKYYFYLYVLN